MLSGWRRQGLSDRVSGCLLMAGRGLHCSDVCSAKCRCSAVGVKPRNPAAPETRQALVRSVGLLQ
ncbi:hypothetical protein [Lysobacter gummosus]|uniref:hypothetical protein n=1 Tax=Lysobacter gummosus TaxID=262324 RepID=UPI003635D916